MSTSSTSTRKRTPVGITALDVESEVQQAGFTHIIGMDEVGRGCIAGPVAVGTALFDLARMLTTPVPPGIADSKQLSLPARKAALEHVENWADHVAVGWSTPAEIDEVGMTAALCLAGRRAVHTVLTALAEAVTVDLDRCLVLLDGTHNWLGTAPTLVTAEAFAATEVVTASGAGTPAVRTYVKGDGRIAGIAAASVAAKVARDDYMCRLGGDCDVYGWAGNVGYPTPAHKAAVREHGPSIHHRRSFKLS